MLPLIISLIVIGSLLLLLLFGLLAIYFYTFYTPFKGQNDIYELTEPTVQRCDTNKINAMIRRTAEYPYEDAYIKSFDHKLLHARMYQNLQSDTVCIMVHGYRGRACRDFSGGAYDMIKRGFNVLLIDHRGHGLSKGHTITFGEKERKDVKSWIDFAKEKFGKDKRIILTGISMGGATVLAASNYLEEGDRVIADCPYSSTKDILKVTMKNLGFNPKYLYFLLHLSAILFAHFNPSKMDVNKYVKDSKAKILIIHGDDDSMVPYHSSLRVYEANKDKVTYVLFPGAEHGLSYMVDEEKHIVNVLRVIGGQMDLNKIWR